MENTRSFHPTCFMLLKKKGREEIKKSDNWQPLYCVDGGRIKDWENSRRWEETERPSEWGLAAGQISCVCGVHTDFMKLISKQQLEEKARQRHMRTATEKGMRNAISLKEEEPAINWCVCIFSYTALHCPALSLFNLRGNFLVKLSWLTLLG